MADPNPGERSLAGVLRQAQKRVMRNLNVSLPGTVISYDDDSGLAVVRPGVNRLVPSMQDANEMVSETLPDIHDVPVCWPVGRGFQIVGGLEQGDTVLLVFLDRDPSGWMTNAGEIQDPEDARLHHISYAVAIPGLVPETSPFPQPTDAAALASRLDALIALLKGNPGSTDAGYAALVVALGVAFPNIDGVPAFPDPVTALSTTGSDVLLLESPG